MHRKPDGCAKAINAKPVPPKVPKSQGGAKVTNPTYSTPTEKMPKRMG